jgi:peroxiredoxin family protein
VDDLKNLLPADSTVDHESVIELIKIFADTWFSLDAYDKDSLSITGTTKKKIKLTSEKLNKALTELKQILIAKGEATDMFGMERHKDALEGIVGNVMQSFAGRYCSYYTASSYCNHIINR